MWKKRSSSSSSSSDGGGGDDALRWSSCACSTCFTVTVEMTSFPHGEVLLVGTDCWSIPTRRGVVVLWPVEFK